MKYDFLVFGIVINIFFTGISISMEKKPSNVPEGLVRTQSLYFEKKTNPIVTTILTTKWDENDEDNKQIQRHLLELAEWHAHEISKDKQEEQIYQSALRKFGKTNPLKIERNLPQLNDPLIKIPFIKNPALKNLMSEINTNIHTITINNFNTDITSNNKKIDDVLKTKGTIKDYEYEHDLQKAIKKQLETIQNKMSFTHDSNELKNDIEKLTAYKNHMSGANIDILKQLEERLIKNIPIPNPEQKTTRNEPIIEKRLNANEEESSQQEIQNPEQAIIPYQPFSIEQLLKQFEAKKTSRVQEEPKSSSSSDSSTSPLSTPSLSPRKPDDISNITKIISHETHKPKVIPEEYISDSSSSSSSAEPSEESTLKKVPQTPVTPSQASEDESSGDTEDESSKESQSLVIPEKSAEEVNSPAPEAQQKDEKPNQLPSSSSSSSSAEEPSTSEVQEPQPSLPWYSKLIEKISAFFDRIFWAIYGYR